MRHSIIAGAQWSPSATASAYFRANVLGLVEASLEEPHECQQPERPAADQSDPQGDQFRAPAMSRSRPVRGRPTGTPPTPDAVAPRPGPADRRVVRTTPRPHPTAIRHRSTSHRTPQRTRVRATTPPARCRRPDLGRYRRSRRAPALASTRSPSRWCRIPSRRRALPSSHRSPAASAASNASRESARASSVERRSVWACARSSRSSRPVTSSGRAEIERASGMTSRRVERWRPTSRARCAASPSNRTAWSTMSSGTPGTAPISSTSSAARRLLWATMSSGSSGECAMTLGGAGVTLGPDQLGERLIRDPRGRRHRGTATCSHRVRRGRRQRGPRGRRRRTAAAFRWRSAARPRWDPTRPAPRRCR